MTTQQFDTWLETLPDEMSKVVTDWLLSRLVALSAEGYGSDYDALCSEFYL